jgi:hypothetical protein
MSTTPFDSNISTSNPRKSITPQRKRKKNHFITKLFPLSTITEVLVKWQGYDEPSWIEESDVDAEALKTMLAEWKLEMDRQQGKGRKSRMRRRKEDV